jgi:hypothetical protein
MRYAPIFVGVAVMAFSTAVPALAHHSAVQFDFTRQVAFKGTVKKFEPINPHMRVVLAVMDAKGGHDVEFEGHSTNNMYRAGYRKGMVKPGDVITVNVAPLKNGNDGGFVLSAITADGKFFGARSSRQAANPEAARSAAEAR